MHSGRLTCFEVKQLLFLYACFARFKTVAVLALKTGGANCNVPKPLWSSRLPIPIRSHYQYETFKCEHFIMHHQLQCKQISNSQAFQSTRESNIIHSDNLWCIVLNWGCKAKNWGYNYCTPCSNVEPPLVQKAPKSTAAGASPRTPLGDPNPAGGAYSAPPDPSWWEGLAIYSQEPHPASILRASLLRSSNSEHRPTPMWSGMLRSDKQFFRTLSHCQHFFRAKMAQPP